MKLNFVLVIGLFFSLNAAGQVGIGTVQPTAELEINATSTLPALELTPQAAPTGTATGQFAVIDEKLYMYDNTRVKWLSVESTALQFGYRGPTNDRFLWFGGDVADIGAIMPYDGTIVYMAINSSGGRTNKAFDIYINGHNVPNNNFDETIDGRVLLNSGSFTRTTYNINFDAGDDIQLFVRNNNGGNVNVQDPTATIWVKWRH